VLPRGATLAGTITDQHGVPVAGAIVGATPAGSSDPRRRIETVADGYGMYRVGPLAGRVTLSVTAYAHGDARLDVDLPRAGEVHRDVELVVADAVLEGTVADASGALLRGATVTIAAGPAAGRSAVTDDAGFRIDRLPPGTISVRVDHPAFPRHHVDATAGSPARLVVPWGGGVDGAVTDRQSGAAIGGAMIVASGPAGARVERAASADGTFSLAPLAPGAWRLSIAHAGYLSLEREVEVPAADRAGATTIHDVALELERGALLAGVVRDRRGSPVAGAAVTLRRAGTHRPLTAHTEADGTFRFRDAPAGAVTLRASKAGASGTLDLITSPGDEELALLLILR
jgi:protocatechuate 3,4-dioxygenase beta subunit